MEALKSNFVPHRGESRKDNAGEGFWRKAWRRLLWAYIDVVVKWTHPKK